MSIRVNNSNFTLVFYKAASNVNPDADENGHDQVHIFQDIFREFLNTSGSNNIVMTLI